MATPYLARRFVPPLLALLSVLACLVAALPTGSAARPADFQTVRSGRFTLFESGQVRPLALSPSGKFLFAANTPDNRLEVFRIQDKGLEHRASIPVGLEPVAVAARSDNEVWVVNHLSDSVSVVDLTQGGNGGRVVRTLLVGDEPRDIVFGGSGKDRAFITTAHRGQNVPFDPQLGTPGVGRADVWVFDADHLGATLTGTPLTIVTLFSDTPRALAASPDGSKVYAAAFHSGNRTTIIPETSVPDGFGRRGALGPKTNAHGDPAPEVGIIVRFNGTHWVDERNRVWDHKVRFSLPDKDIFVIDANANPPAQLGGTAGFYRGVGTILYNMVVNPVNGKVYVSNTEAGNEKRFEGPGEFAGHSIRGHLHESRITVLGQRGSVTPRHLNKHINYDECCDAIPNAENDKSLALPQEMAVTSDGRTLYVATLGTSKIGVFDTSALEDNTFTPNTADQIKVSGGGLTGLVLDEGRQRLYTLTRFDNSIAVIDTVSGAEVAHVAMHNPEPPSVVAGRPFLYDTSFSSSHGDSSCASCHVFGDFDSLAWDLGNPDEEVIDNPGPFLSTLFNLVTQQPMEPILHPMKGPMTTQSLRGMANHGPMHWRGDRTGGNDAPNAQPDSGTFDERAAFDKFNGGFTNLLGRHTVIPQADMDAFTDFILQVTYPPNPNRPLNNVLTADQRAGRRLFDSVNCGIPSAPELNGVVLKCSSCHAINPNANPGTAAPGFFGTSGRSSFAFNPQLFKVPHLRNVYQKVGMFGNAENPGFPGSDTSFKGDQVRGFGLLHDGNVDTVFRFTHGISFSEGFNGPGNNGIPDGPAGGRPAAADRGVHPGIPHRPGTHRGPADDAHRRERSRSRRADRSPDRPRPGRGVRSGGQGREQPRRKGLSLRRRFGPVHRQSEVRRAALRRQPAATRPAERRRADLHLHPTGLGGARRHRSRRGWRARRRRTGRQEKRGESNPRGRGGDAAAPCSSIGGLSVFRASRRKAPPRSDRGGASLPTNGRACLRICYPGVMRPQTRTPAAGEDWPPRWEKGGRFWAGLEEADRFFRGEAAVQRATERIVRLLEENGIPYAILGGMALNAYGFIRVTNDVDLLLNADGLEAFKALHPEPTELGVRIHIFLAGRYPGDGCPKPVAYPDPALVAVRGERMALLPLPRIIELKLASGMTAPERLKDLADVLETIRALKLPAELADELDPYVREKYRELWQAAQIQRPE